MNSTRIAAIAVCILLLSGSSTLGGVRSAGTSGGKHTAASPSDKAPQATLYLPDRVIVKLQHPVALAKGANVFGLAALDEAASRYSVQSIQNVFPAGGTIDLSRFYVLRYTSPVDARAVAEELSKLPEVAGAEPWFVHTIDDNAGCTPNDPSRSLQWGLTKVLADSAWCVNSGDTTVVIGIIDTGTQWDHPDLAANIWINPGEYGPDGHGGRKETNGVDDDGNGFVDDWHGWDFGGADYLNVVPDNDPGPVNTASAHGTHTAGIASAATNNGVGVAGMAYKCKILPVKTSSDNDNRGSGGTPYIVYGLEGIVYAAEMGARVVSCSWGSSSSSQFEQEWIDSVTAHGTLVVAAAGNTYSNTYVYPASYQGVLSVGSTGTTDLKSGYSTYNDLVDVSAPGENVWSTYYPSTYQYSTGTSMSTPLAAGLAALVASAFPSYGPLQVGEQVRISCDTIDALNPAYRGLIGRGRINAYRALTLMSPSFRISSTRISDSAGGNNNGVLEPNEDFTITVAFTNYLQASSPAASVTLLSPDTNVTVQSGVFPLGAVPMMGSVSNSSSPFRLHVGSNPPPGRTVSLTLKITDVNYTDAESFDILLNPTFATHDVNNVIVTLSNIGRIGYSDLTNTYGQGFIYGGGDQLYEGGLMMGTSATKLVDVVRNPSCQTCQDNDFSSSQIYSMVTPGTISNQDGSTVFTDASASPSNKLGVQVNMFSYAFTSAADSNYVLLRYDILNTGASQISNMYAGLFLDWDMLPNYATNRTSYDAARRLGYAWDNAAVNPVYCGAEALEGPGTYYGLVNNGSIDLSRAGKWSWLSSGVVTTDSIQDIHFVVSTGPFTIPAGGKQMLGFALLGGNNLAHLQSGADAAQAKWNYIKTLLDVKEQPGGIPSVYALRQNYPNPFNPATTISYDLPVASRVSLKVYDIMGREVAVLAAGEKAAGSYTARFDASQLATGVYIYRLTASPAGGGGRAGSQGGVSFSDSKKFLVVK